MINLEDFDKVDMRVGTEELIGKQVIVVTNFEPIRIADVKSEVRILGADTELGVVLLNLERKVENGAKIF